MTDDDIDSFVDDVIDESKEKEQKQQNITIPESFKDPIPEDEIGHITAQESDLIIGRQENTIKVFIQPDNRDDIQVGDYLRIPIYKTENIKIENKDVNVKEQLLATVDSLEYNTRKGVRDETEVSVDSFGDTNYIYKATLKPISIVSYDPNEDDPTIKPEQVNKPPQPTTRVGQVQNKEFLRCGLEIPENGVFVGDMAVHGKVIPSENNPLEYYMFNPNCDDNNSDEGEPTIFRHALVAGSTGTGKTHTSKNILRQYAKCKRYEIKIPESEATEKKDIRQRRMNLTIIDPENEYASMGNDPSNIKEVEKIAEKREGLAYGGIDTAKSDTDFQIFAPGVKNVDPATTGHKTTVFGIPFEIVKYHRQLMMPADPGEPTQQAINTILGQYFTIKTHHTYRDFRNWFAAEEVDFKEQFGDSIFDAAKRRLTDPVYDKVFDQGTKSLTDNGFAEEMFAAGQVSVITTGHLRGKAESFIIQSLLSYVVDNKISSNVNEPHIKGTPLVLALDEAHEYLTEPETTRESYIVNKFRRAARRGRKDKFGLYLITQNPQDIDGEVRNQLNSKIYLKLDRRVVESGDVFIPPDFKHQVPQFKLGQMVVSQPNVQDVEVKGLDVCLTEHNN